MSDVGNKAAGLHRFLYWLSYRLGYRFSYRLRQGILARLFAPFLAEVFAELFAQLLRKPLPKPRLQLLLNPLLNPLLNVFLNILPIILSVAGIWASFAVASDSLTNTLSANHQLGKEYVGSKACQSCHSEAYKEWQQSHHFHSMQPANKRTVVANFNNTAFVYNGLKHRFSMEGDEYFVTTDNKEGKLERFKVAYTFGIEPLQQYLIAMPNGRYQVLSINWDNRPIAEGGQRWFHLYPEDEQQDPQQQTAIDANHALHWTGAFQNWNSRCASCHSTQLVKHYDAKHNQFNSQFSEHNVACEACHGPASAHLEWANSFNAGESNNTDKAILTLQDRGEWRFKDNSTIAHRLDQQQPQQQVETCAACHALRSELSNQAIDVSRPFADQFDLRLLEPHFYRVDGYIDDEVFVYGSFLQSKMAQAGVVCTDCHSPHSGKVRGGSQAVCLQCHQAEHYQQSSHHQHQVGTAGSFCVDCHMPAKTYMGVDARRDHSFSIPHPELSQALGIENSCNACHQDKSVDWAVKARQQWPNQQHFQQGLDVDYSKTMHASRQGDPAALTALIALIHNPKQPDIKRASALLELQQFPSSEAYHSSLAMLQHTSPMIRAAAVRSLSYLPPAQRIDLLRLSQDPTKSVRMAAAELLAELPIARLSNAEQQQLSAVLAEYQAMQQAQADMPSAQLALANLYIGLNDLNQAEQALKQALVILPQHEAALLSMAELYRLLQQPKQEGIWLDQAIALHPNQQQRNMRWAYFIFASKTTSKRYSIYSRPLH
ncbi:MAG: HEAT repeat domain-containing protein [Pseudomonadales bacterium]|nr:HEAT repeat domain-containing protein [Pseudomonadales bacterium]